LYGKGRATTALTLEETLRLNGPELTVNHPLSNGFDILPYWIFFIEGKFTFQEK